MFLQDYEPKWAEVDGVRTRYFEAGEGPAAAAAGATSEALSSKRCVLVNDADLAL